MDSDDYTSDDKKRKQNEESEQNELFRKSRKIIRTPTKQSVDKMDILMNMLKELTSEVKEIRKEQNNYREEISELRRDNIVMKQHYEELRKENETIKNEMQIMNDKMEQQDRDKRRNNIIVSGIDLEGINIETLVIELNKLLGDNLGIKINFKSAFKIGPKTCLAELYSWNDKREVLQNKYKLRKVKDKVIYINDDLTKNEREIQSSIMKRANEEKKAAKQVKVGYQKLIINGTVWKWDKENKKLIESNRVSDIKVVESGSKNEAGPRNGQRR